MKQLYAFILLLLVSTGLRAQSAYVETFPQVLCAGNSTFFSLIDSSTGATIPAYWIFGDGSPLTYGSQVSHIYSTPGLYSGYAAATIGGGFDTVAFVHYVGGSCTGGSHPVSGTVYYDYNRNGVMDGDDLPAEGAIMTLEPGNFHFSTNAQGRFGITLPDGSYSISTTPSLQYYHTTNPPSGVIAFTLTGGTGALDSLDFAYTCEEDVKDLAVSLTSGPAVRGTNELIYVSYVNHGTIPMDGNVEITLNPDVTYVAAGGLGSTASYTAPIVNFAFTGLLPLETRDAVITVHVPAALALGTVLKYSAIIHPVPGDTLPADNYDSLGVVVVGSCDPNDKLVYPSGTIMPEQKLEYTIRFQNTGTWWAENVVIRDTLDSDLDVSTFTPNGTSHACNWAVSGNIVDWTFMGIHLPDSNLDEPNSHGYVSFTIRPKPGVVNGTLITNDAGIYFDFNPVVMTNITSNTVSIVGVADPQNTFGLEVFPNPFSSGAMVRFQNPQHVAHQVLLTDLTGRVLMHWDDVTGQEVRIDGGSLAAGSYLVSCTRPDGTRSVAKVLVQ